jgi:hypothetical protein
LAAEDSSLLSHAQIGDNNDDDAREGECGGAAFARGWQTEAEDKGATEHTHSLAIKQFAQHQLALAKNTGTTRVKHTKLLIKTHVTQLAVKE